MSHPILDKVKKLLALANDAGASEGERDNALRMAHGLLAKHNLDMNDLQQHLQIEDREDYVNETFGMLWCRQVSNSIAKLFFCKYYFGKKVNGTKMQHHFVGKTSNAGTAALMAEYVISSILKECRTHFKHNLAPESRSFSRGATARINDRVNEMIKEARPEGATSTSLVVVELYKTEADANEAFIKASGTSLITRKAANTKVDMRAYKAGNEFGGKIGLNNQVTNRSQLKIGAK